MFFKNIKRSIRVDKRRNAVDVNSIEHTDSRIVRSLSKRFFFPQIILRIETQPRGPLVSVIRFGVQTFFPFSLSSSERFKRKESCLLKILSTEGAVGET